MNARGLAILLLLTASPASAQPQQPQPGAAPTEAPLTLADLERLALAQQPTIKAAVARLDAARARGQQAGAWSNPTIGFTGEELGSRSGRRGELGGFIEFPFVLGGKLGRARTIEEREADRADAELALQSARIRQSVRAAFYDVLTLEQRVAVQDRLASLVSEAVGVTAQLFNVGAADRPDVLEAEVELRRVQLDGNTARNRVYAARERLAAMAGDPRVAGRRLAGSPDDALPELERDATLRRLLDESPQVRAARADVARAQAATAAASRATFPDLFLRVGGVYNRQISALTGAPIGWLAEAEAGMTVPLFNRNNAGVHAARADELRAEAERQRLELALRAEFAGVWAEYLSAARESETYRKEILPRAEEAYRLYLARYKEMAAAYPQVLVAQRRLLELSSEYLRSVESAWRSALDLQGLLAGDGLELAGTGDSDRVRDTLRGGVQ